MFKNIINIVGSAAIIGLHWYTGWAFILYFLSVFYAILITILGIGLVLILIKGEATEIKKLTKVQIATSCLTSAMYFVYFLFTASYVISSLLVVLVILTLAVRALCIKK